MLTTGGGNSGTAAFDLPKSVPLNSDRPLSENSANLSLELLSLQPGNTYTLDQYVTIAFTNLEGETGTNEPRTTC